MLPDVGSTDRCRSNLHCSRYEARKLPVTAGNLSVLGEMMTETFEKVSMGLILFFSIH